VGSRSQGGGVALAHSSGGGRVEGFLREVGEPATERVLPQPLEAPPDMARLIPIAERNGMVILGPPGPPPGQ
jgi:hypothetical protein